MNKKVISVVLVLSMLVGMLSIMPISISAAETITISSVDDWLTKLSGNGYNDVSADVTVTAKELDFSGKTVYPVQNFKGTFDGNGVVIKNLTMSPRATGEVVTGLFRNINGDATIKNFVITNSTFNREQYSSVVAAQIGAGTTTIENVFVDKSVTLTTTDGHSGGLIGALNSKATGATVKNCVFAGTLNFGSGKYVGGVVGNAGGKPVTVENCLFAGALNGTDGTRSVFASGNGNTDSIIKNCLSLSSINLAYQTTSKTFNIDNSKKLGDVGFETESAIVGEDASLTIAGWTKRDGDYMIPSTFLDTANGFGTLPQLYVAPEHTEGSFAGGTGTESDPYTIENAEQWIYFSNTITENNGYSGKYIKLAKDIIFNEGISSAWGTVAPENKIAPTQRGFAGHFDGAGHTVSGIYMSTDFVCSGLFSTTANGAVIKNLAISNSYIFIDQKGWSGILLGDALGTTTIENIFIDKDVYLVTNVDGCLGGIVGAVENNATLTVNNCIFAGTIDSPKDYNGGIVGNATTCEVNVESCVNAGTVKGNKYNSGIVGVGTAKVSINNCISIGYASNYAIGGSTKDDSKINIENCYYLPLMSAVSSIKATETNVNKLDSVTDLIGASAKITLEGFTKQSDDVMIPSGLVELLSDKGTLLEASQEYGASVRIDTSSAKTTGIRWTGIITNAYLEELKASGKNYSFGMIIAPVDYITSDFTKAELEKLDITTPKYKIVEAANTVNCDGYAKFYCSLGGIQEKNLGREFAARIYVCIDGEYTYYGYNKSANARSVTFVAGAAFKDLASERSDKYCNEVATGSGKMYSPYTATQIKTLESYMYAQNANLATDADIRVMSYNVLSDLYGDKLAIAGRDVAIMSIINQYAPAVIGLQEATPNWMTSLKALKGSNYVILDENYINDGDWWQTITGGETTYNASPIMYDTSVLDCYDHGVTPYSDSEDVHMRVISWAKFKVIGTDIEFVAVNTHWDPDNTQTATDRTVQAQALYSFIEGQTLPVIVLGDFNTKTGNALFTDNGFEGENAIVTDAKSVEGIVVNSQDSVDHIFGTSKVVFKLYNTVTDNVAAGVSDHKPIYADVTFN